MVEYPHLSACLASDAYCDCAQVVRQVLTSSPRMLATSPHQRLISVTQILCSPSRLFNRSMWGWSLLSSLSNSVSGSLKLIQLPAGASNEFPAPIKRNASPLWRVIQVLGTQNTIPLSATIHHAANGMLTVIDPVRVP